MTSPGTPGTRVCDYCDAEFTPVDDAQRYCKKGHQAKAAHKRRHGIAPRLFSVQTAMCPWCGKTFETLNADQRYCSPEHRTDAITCGKKQRFLSEDAAAAAAGTYPVLRGEVDAYRCPRPKALPHWHLRNVDKRKQNKRKKERKPSA